MAKKAQETDPGEKLLVKNRRASFDYDLEEHFEAGLVLMGSEVKAMRAGKVDLTDAWASVEKDGIYMRNLTVQVLPHTAFAHEPRRARKLLLNAREIDEIKKSIDHDKKTLIPLRIYLKGGLIKTEIALAAGKKKGDKRQAIKAREATREATSAMRRAHKG